MLLILVTSLQVIAAAILIMFILLHAGRGGGLSDMFGGGMSLGGSTLAEKNLDRLTVFAASTFVVATIGLGLIMADRDRDPAPSSSIPTTVPSGIPTTSDEVPVDAVPLEQSSDIPTSSPPS